MLPTSLRSSLRTLSALLAALLMPALSVHAQSVSVSAPDTAAVRGDTVAVPISVSGLDQASDVTAYGFDLAFAADSLTYVGVDTVNTLTGRAGFTVDDNPSVPRIGAFGSTPLNDTASEGILLRLQIEVAAAGTTAVRLPNLQLNDGTPATTPTQPTFSVVGTPPNLPPSADDDRYETTEDQSVQVGNVANGVLGNDTDPNGDALTAGLGPSVDHGTLSFNSNGTFTYTPNTGFTGTDTFRYAASDPGGSVDSATVTIAVDPPNTAPSITTLDDQTISEDGTTGPLAFSISDPETDPQNLTLRATTDAPSLVPDDSLQVQGSGADRTLTAAPVANASGTAMITLTVSDGADSTQQALTLTVQPVNDAPVGTDDQYRMAAGDTLRVTETTNGLLDNDRDIDDSDLSAALVDSTSNGALTLDSTGTFTYAPLTDFTGEDAFTYAVTDGRGGRDTAGVDLTVWPRDSVSVQAKAVTAAPGDTAAVPITVQGLDAAAGITSYSFELQYDAAAVAYSGVSTDSTLSGRAGFTVEDNPDAARIAGFGAAPLDSVAAEGPLLHLHFAVTAEDTTTVRLNRLQFNTGFPPARPSTPTATITGDAPNRSPRASSDRYTTTEGISLTIADATRGVLANDADADGDALTASLLSSPENGTLSFDEDGTFEYRPESAFTGTDTFRYRVSDPEGRVDSTTVHLSVAVDKRATVQIDDAVVGLHDTVSVPVRIGQLDQAKDITAYGFDLSFDSTRASYVGYSTQNTLSAQADFTVNDNPDLPRIGAFGSTALNAEGTQGVLLRLQFEATALGKTQVSLDNLQFNEGEPAPRPDALSFAVAGPTAVDSVSVDAETEFQFPDTGVSLLLSGLTDSGTVVAEKFGISPDSTGNITEENVSAYHYRIRTASSLSYDKATLYFDESTMAGIDKPGNVTAYRRGHDMSQFRQLSTSYNTNEFSMSADGLGTFVFASNTESLPVELASFDARFDEETVRLTWRTAAERNNAGFRIQRRAASAAEARSNEASSGRENTWTTVGSRSGAGTTSTPERYRFTDAELPYEADALTYRLKQVDTDGAATYSAPVTVRRGVEAVQLLGTSPNPARQQATIRYAVPDAQHVTLRVFDVLGRQVRTLTSATQSGRQERRLDASDLPSGVYFLRLTAGNTVKTQRLTVVH